MSTLITILMFSLVVAAISMVSRGYHAMLAERREKLRILDDALERGNLDPATRDDLIETLGGRRRRPEKVEVTGFWRLLFGLGWLMLFLAAGLLISGDRHAEEPAAVIGFIALAFLSLPFAMRELDGRKRAHG